MLSLLGIGLYIWFRFEWQYSLAALIALAHDIIATIGFYALTQIEFNLATLAAVLTIAGYSINDTVVIFDRVRETLRKYKKMAFLELLNLSINLTLSRTILTSVTTLIALIALFLFGGEVIRGFAIGLIWGVVIGTYSSVGLAVPLLARFHLRGGAVGGGSEDKQADDQTTRRPTPSHRLRSRRRGAPHHKPFATRRAGLGSRPPVGRSHPLGARGRAMLARCGSPILPRSSSHPLPPVTG